MSIKKRFFEFALWLTIVALFLLAVYQVVYIIWPNTPVANYVAYIFLVPYLLNLLIYFLMLKGLTLDPHYFVQIIILSIVVKLILFGAFNFIMIYYSPETAMANVITFFAIYLATTILELGMFVPLVSKNDDNQSSA
ncbi:MAG: hypothetical protein ABJH05_16830 [Fulvivirga sp.]